MSLDYKKMHVPVLLKEVIVYLCNDSFKIFLDATIGSGGHALHVLERLKKTMLIGIDMDEDALHIAQERLKKYKDRVYLFHENFKNLDKVVKSIGLDRVNVCFFDLGLSAIQLGGKRGFSFNEETFLDMRMDKRGTIRAYDVVNCYGYERLIKILKEYGEEREAERIARAIVDERKKAPIEDTKRLSEIIKKAKNKKGKIHPATKTFQAIRIEVNDEITNLKETLPKAEEILEKKGRLGVISFHSIEDRIVKNFIRNAISLSPITRTPIRPSREEIKINRRARSARLRIGEKR